MEHFVEFEDVCKYYQTAHDFFYFLWNFICQFTVSVVNYFMMKT